MPVHRWRAVIDFYADDTHEPERMAAWFRTVTTHQFPLGVVEGPDVWDTDDKIEAIRRIQRGAWLERHYPDCDHMPHHACGGTGQRKDQVIF